MASNTEGIRARRVERRSQPPNCYSRRRPSLTRRSGETVNRWAPSHKRCSSRSRWLPLEDFPLNRRMHWGRSSHCRECARQATSDWRESNRDRINSQRRQTYRDEHPLPVRPCVVCGKTMSRRPDAVLSLMQQQATAFNLPLADLSLDGFDADRDLL